MIPKIRPIVSAKLRAASDGRSCIRCERNGRLRYDTSRAHYTGPFQHVFGGGMGKKVSDLASCTLCYDCHTSFDQYQHSDPVAASEEMLMLCLLELHRDVASGLIKVPK